MATAVPVDMMVAVNRGMILAMHIGRMRDAGTAGVEDISFGKMDNVRMALEVARTARSVLGANGITLEYPVIRHMNNLESVYTYEGTHDIHSLIDAAVESGSGLAVSVMRKCGKSSENSTN